MSRQNARKTTRPAPDAKVLGHGRIGRTTRLMQSTARVRSDAWLERCVDCNDTSGTCDCDGEF